MEPTIKTYSVKIIREAGSDPVSGRYYDYTEQQMDIDANSPKQAYQVSLLACGIPFHGQIRRTFIDGEEYFDERF